MVTICNNCGLPRFSGPYGYVGEVCMCGYAPRFTPLPPPTDPLRQLTEDDVRRIVREELQRHGPDGSQGKG